MTPYLLLAALAWTVAARGGTGGRDLIVVLGLLVVAVFAGRAWPRRNLALWAAVAALLCWLVADGPLRSDWTLGTVRMPLLVAITALTALVVHRMNGRERDTLVTGLVLVGCLQAVIALGEVVMWAVIEPSVSPRVGALLGSPNGLGMLLVATSVLTVRELDRRGGWLPVAALVLQGSALLATGSRTAILVASLLLVGYVATHAGWRRGMLAAAGLAVGIAVVAWRTVTERQDRPGLWLEALRRIADQPLVGEGPASAPFLLASPGARITAHAHNEVLQWGVEYGLVGIVLGVVVLVLAIRSVRRPFGGDRWLQLAALALLVAGLTDFTLRITAITLTAAVLTTLAVTGSRPAPAHTADLPAHTAAR